MLTVDASGQVSRVKLERTTGYPALDKAIIDLLKSIRTSERPPNGKPFTIRLRLNLQK